MRGARDRNAVVAIEIPRRVKEHLGLDFGHNFALMR
jgi:hypothetical protein